VLDRNEFEQGSLFVVRLMALYQLLEVKLFQCLTEYYPVSCAGFCSSRCSMMKLHSRLVCDKFYSERMNKQTCYSF
jgi:hypothetical protein